MQEAPSPVHPALARVAVADFLTHPQWRQRGVEYGWSLSEHDELTILAVLVARSAAGTADQFTLRLECEYYPTHPPDVRFVNPTTLEYDPERDRIHLARLEAPYCYVHPIYPYPAPYRYGPQLVCSSMTLGYYVSGHSPTPDQRWDQRRHSIGSTLVIVHRALRSEHYKGRHGS